MLSQPTALSTQNTSSSEITMSLQVHLGDTQKQLTFHTPKYVSNKNDTLICGVNY